jgi:hypothetical protein
VARVTTVQTPIEAVVSNGVLIKTVETRTLDVEGLPEPEDGVIYITSSLVAGKLPSRPDVLAPDTGPTAVRDENGHIVAVNRLQKP